MVPGLLMPEYMKDLSQLTPHAWALAGYHDVIIRDLGVRAVLTESGVLFSFADLFFIIARWHFRFD